MWEGWQVLADQSDLECRVCGSVAEPLLSRQESQSSIPNIPTEQKLEDAYYASPKLLCLTSLRKPVRPQTSYPKAGDHQGPQQPQRE